jgi:hypothetical protein
MLPLPDVILPPVGSAPGSKANNVPEIERNTIKVMAPHIAIALSLLILFFKTNIPHSLIFE